MSSNRLILYHSETVEVYGCIIHISYNRCTVSIMICINSVTVHVEKDGVILVTEDWQLK